MKGYEVIPRFRTDGPFEDGLYAAEVYFGWKLLAWKDGEWWHPEYVGRWSADTPLQWVGPLPALRKQKAPEVFDL